MIVQNNYKKIKLYFLRPKGPGVYFFGFFCFFFCMGNGTVLFHPVNRQCYKKLTHKHIPKRNMLHTTSTVQNTYSHECYWCRAYIHAKKIPNLNLTMQRLLVVHGTVRLSVRYHAAPFAWHSCMRSISVSINAGLKEGRTSWTSLQNIQKVN